MTLGWLTFYLAILYVLGIINEILPAANPAFSRGVSGQSENNLRQGLHFTIG